jgi:hypothetical protein
MKPALRLLALLAAVGGLAGCASPGKFTDATHQGPFFQPRNFAGAAQLPASIRRVAILPVHGGEFAPPEAVEPLDPVFATALERQMRFEVVMVPRDECQKCFGTPDVASVAALPHEILAELGRKYAADAIMFVDVTAYQSYRPLVLGVRAKLALVADRSLLWTFDEVFSTSVPAVVNSVRRYYYDNELGHLPFDLTPGALQSPSRFAAYAADATFHTLPAR